MEVLGVERVVIAVGGIGVSANPSGEFSKDEASVVGTGVVGGVLGGILVTALLYII